MSEEALEGLGQCSASRHMSHQHAQDRNRPQPVEKGKAGVARGWGDSVGDLGGHRVVG